MKENSYSHVLSKNEIEVYRYPKLSIFIVMMLVYLAPFVSSLLAYLALIICVYRVVRYDARVFATDYCLLMPVARLFSTSGGFSLLVVLCFFAGIWYVILRGIRVDGTYIFLFLILNYLILRTRTEITRFALCFGHLFVLCVVLPLQDDESSSRSAKTFCTGLLIASTYAMLFRNTWQIRSLIGDESEAIWGTGIMRFMGLTPDPNYYMAMILIALALLTKLKDCGRVGMLGFWTSGIILTIFGMLTYSKTFLVVFVLLGGTYIIWQFYNRKAISAMVLSLAAVLLVSVLLLSSESNFAIIVNRLTGAKDLDSITTGRLEVFKVYWKAITNDFATFFFGCGLWAKELFKSPHNIIIQIMYHLGLVGFVLITGLYLSMVRVLKRWTSRIEKQNIIAQNVVLWMTLVTFMSLHGIFQIELYGDFFVAFLSIMITKKQPMNQVLKNEERLSE